MQVLQSLGHIQQDAQRVIVAVQGAARGGHLAHHKPGQGAALRSQRQSAAASVEVNYVSGLSGCHCSSDNNDGDSLWLLLIYIVHTW